MILLFVFSFWEFHTEANGKFMYKTAGPSSFGEVCDQDGAPSGQRAAAEAAGGWEMGRAVTWKAEADDL